MRIAEATSAAGMGASSGTMSASCSAKSPMVWAVTLATMARTWPADRVPLAAAAAVTGSTRSRLAGRAVRAASAEIVPVRSRSQAVMEVAASRSHNSA